MICNSSMATNFNWFQNMKTHTPELIIPDIEDTPFSYEAGLLSDKIKDELIEAIDTNSMSLTEMAGMLGLGASLRSYADGRLPGLIGHSFMRILAEKKTPAPIARTENMTYFNIKEGIAEMINKNPEALTRTNKIADEQRKQIQAKLRTDNLLMLNKQEVSNISKSEPAEIQKLRGEAGG